MSDAADVVSFNFRCERVKPYILTYMFLENLTANLYSIIIISKTCSLRF